MWMYASLFNVPNFFFKNVLLPDKPMTEIFIIVTNVKLYPSYWKESNNFSYIMYFCYRLKVD